MRDLSGVLPELHLPTLGLAGLRRLRALDPGTLPKVRGTPRLGHPQ